MADEPSILVGMDDKPASEHALVQALELATSRGASLVIVQVIGGYDPFKKMEYGAHEHIVDTTAQAQKLEDRVQKLVSAWAADTGVPAPPVVCEVQVGPAGRVLSESAERHGANLVVVGNRNRSKLSRAVLGSVAEDLLRRAKVAVLVVRSKDS